ncbi:2-isopropylmalate synthase [Asticcacaulis sp. EMRT-3]|uniref:2-isopropylmalate synthase n=1 Tax=Asticcacaulis sp. EMRT-3 TaxID=3040349 RepID=UPI0024AE9474|nr:2-isopropylmalate synthase [Asticcacaulis sp. EMRT-3]MDI7775470.1 2-isopropylmalate synthase [Asticcacaulis sp. EMRT-3]
MNSHFTPKPPTDRDRVLVFDTSLRDGEQAPGFSLGVRDKLRMAHALSALGVDILEAGFAAASPGDEEAIRVIASEVAGPVFCSLSRALESDLDAAARALAPARRSRAHIFLATSPIHRAAKLKKSRIEVLETAVRAVAYAAGMFDEVEFSPEDAIRTEADFLTEICQAVVEAGATTLNIPDTVGYATPDEIRNIFAGLRTAIPDPAIILSAHCHNDLGLAVANSLAALQGGARQIECTINGIGERAGNCSLEEVVMALKVRPDLFDLHTGINTTHLTRTSRLLARATGSVMARNKAVVGKNAFAHESGIHQHGMLSDARTYEIMRPEDVGLEKSNMVLGKHSGRHAIAKQATALGFALDDQALGEVFASFKRRADEIGEIDEHELRALLGRGASATGDMARIAGLRTQVTATGASIALDIQHDDRSLQTVIGEGRNAFDAGLHALTRAYGTAAEVIDCEITQAGFDFDSGAFAEMTLSIKGEVYRGRGRGPDSVWAGLRALCDAFEKSVFLTPLNGRTEAPVDSSFKIAENIS